MICWDANRSRLLVAFLAWLGTWSALSGAEISVGEVTLANFSRIESSQIRRLPHSIPTYVGSGPISPRDIDVVDLVPDRLLAGYAYLSQNHCPDYDTPGPTDFDVTGRCVKFTVSARLQLDAMHDFKALGLDPDKPFVREFITALIPVGGEAARRVNRSALSPNQTLMDAVLESPTRYGKLYTFTRFNLTKSAYETEFQLYKAYIRWGWIKAGYDYTLWLNQGAQPSTLDFEGPNAAAWVRYPQFSVKIPCVATSEDSGLFWVLGCEYAKSGITLPDDANVVNQLPSLIGKLAYETDRVHIELTGLYRYLLAKGDKYRSSVYGWGTSASAGIQTWGKDRFVIAGNLGEGIGNYNEDTFGLNLDAAPRSKTDKDLKSIPSVSGWVGYEHWWAPYLRSSTTFGYVYMDSGFIEQDFIEQDNSVGTYHYANYASTNIIWSPVPYVDVGVEYLYGQRRVTNSTKVDGHALGDNHRIQATIRWRFSNRP